jgi:predicted dithiol-disulfide oxidoreductase (DUF899 family)
MLGKLQTEPCPMCTMWIDGFTQHAVGVIRHVYTAQPRMSANIDQPGIDRLSLVWHLMDLTPEGRGELVRRTELFPRHAVAH